jgi:hypothetical protein
MELFPYILSQERIHMLVYRKATDFCKLILYPATLLKLFMVYRSFWVEIFGSLRYRIMFSANRDTLTISLPICIPFISSSYLFALAKNSRTMLNILRIPFACTFSPDLVSPADWLLSRI